MIYLIALYLTLLMIIEVEPVEDKYTTNYDNMDIDEIIKSERLLKNYVDCLLERGGCTPAGTELKKNVRDAIETNCAKCSKRQKDASEQLIHYLFFNKPKDWEDLEKKYDPSGDYTQHYLAN